MLQFNIQFHFHLTSQLEKYYAQDVFYMCGIGCSKYFQMGGRELSPLEKKQKATLFRVDYSWLYVCLWGRRSMVVAIRRDTFFCVAFVTNFSFLSLASYKLLRLGPCLGLNEEAWLEQSVEPVVKRPCATFF